MEVRRRFRDAFLKFEYFTGFTITAPSGLFIKTAQKVFWIPEYEH
jgi:hypothetical protein